MGRHQHTGSNKQIDAAAHTCDAWDSSEFGSMRLRSALYPLALGPLSPIVAKRAADNLLADHPDLRSAVADHQLLNFLHPATGFERASAQ